MDAAAMGWVGRQSSMLPNRLLCHKQRLTGPGYPSPRLDFFAVTWLSQSCDFYAAVVALPT